MTARHPARIVIVGGGLAGLSAARELLRHRIDVHVVEARDRLGGRVRTVRDADGVHAEAGGEFIDEPHDAIRTLAHSLRLPLVRVLRRGFGLALHDGRRTTFFPSADRPWRAIARRLRPVVDAYRDAGASWDGAAGVAIAGRSVDALVPPDVRPAQARACVEALRGFYLAEPEALSALVLVDQLLGGEPPGRTVAWRVRGGNDRLIEALARDVRRRGRVDVGCAVRAIVQDRGGVRVAATGRDGRTRQIAADYAVVTLPAPLVRACRFDPPLPVRQCDALAALSMGAATKMSLRFDRPWWRRPGWPRGFGSNLPCGAVWEAGEEQRAAVLTLLGGASASASLASAASRPGGIAALLRVFGPPAADGVAIGGAVSWEREPWSTGGYAVFGPGFDPRDRRLLSAAHGRVLFAGEHTSERWQGFMNGAVESGQAAAREAIALVRLERASQVSSSPPSSRPAPDGSS
jgi:monoamine oxidase